MSTDGKPRTKRNGHAKSQTVASTLRDSANQIWLAGLGAYARAEEEGTRVFDQLVALGERVEARARDQVLRPIHAAERIRSAIDNTAFDMDGNCISSTVSIGIASFPECVTEAKQVLNKADVALYKSKNTGRNRVTYYEEALEATRACA